MPLLQELDVEAYFGVPLNASDGMPLGVMMVMHNKPLARDTPSPSPLAIIASRAAAELERLDMEDQRLESDFRMRAIIDAAPFGAHLYALQSDGRLVFIGGNRSADRILGIRHHDLVGKTIEEAFPGLQKQGIPDAYRKVASTGTPFEIELLSYEQDQIAGGVRGSCIPDITRPCHRLLQGMSPSAARPTLLPKKQAGLKQRPDQHQSRIPDADHRHSGPGISPPRRNLLERHREMLDGITASASRLHTTLDEILKLVQLTSERIQPKKLSFAPGGCPSARTEPLRGCGETARDSLALNPVHPV